MPNNRIIIVGGISVNDKEHDGSPWNFINPGVRRAKALKTAVSMIFYTPSYERRVKGQKAEHTSVTNPSGDVSYFLKVVEKAAKDHTFTLHKITSAAELTKQLKAITTIESIDYVGHSNDRAIFLEYSSITSAESKDLWKAADALGVPATQFVSRAVFASYGCNQGDVGGLAEKLREQWRIRTIGSRGKTDFTITGPFGGPTFPTSASGYVEYPAPAVDAKAALVYPLPAARTLKYSKDTPPS